MAKKFFDIIPPQRPDLLAQEHREQKTESKIISSNRIGNDITGPKRFYLKGLILGLVFIILTVIFNLFFVSKIKIEIWPEAEVINLNEIITVDLNVSGPDFEAKVIPGKIFNAQRSISQKFISSGKVQKEEKATGIIRVYNNYHLTQSLVINTRFQPPLKKFKPPLEEGESPWFRTVETISIPAKGYSDVRVVADSPRAKYNIEPSKFSIPGLRGLSQYTLVYGESFQEFEGGSKGEISRVVQEDLERAENVLVERLITESRNSLRNIIPQNFVLLDGALFQEIIESNASVEAGAEVDSFNYQVKISAEGLVFEKTDIENFVNNFINLNVAEGKIVQENSLETNYSIKSINRDSGKIVLVLEITARIYSDINLIELKKALSGKSLTETEIFLENLDQITKVDLKPWPFWKKRIPEDIGKININLNLGSGITK